MIRLKFILLFFCFSILKAEFSFKTIENQFINSQLFRYIRGCSSQLLVCGALDYNIKNNWYKFFYSNDGGLTWTYIPYFEKFEKDSFEFITFFRHSLTEFTLLGNKLNKIANDSDTIIIKSGFILRSNDLCKSWVEEFLPDSINFRYARMINQKKGYSAGKNFILKTEDNWQTYSYYKTPEMVEELNFYFAEDGAAVYFPNERLNFYFYLFKLNEIDSSITTQRVSFELNQPHTRTYFKFNTLDTGLAFVEYYEPYINPPNNFLDIYITYNAGSKWELIYRNAAGGLNRNIMEYDSLGTIILISANHFYISQDYGLNWKKYLNTLYQNEYWLIPRNIYIVNQDSIYFSDIFQRLIYRDYNMEVMDDFLEDKNLSFYPQPASDKLFLNSKNLDYINSDISISNNLGIKVFQTKMNIISNQDNFIELNTLPSGLYFMVLKAADQTVTTKFLIFRE